MKRPTEDHLDPGALLDHVLAEHLADARLQPGARTHLANCETCRLGLEEVETMIADMRGDRFHLPAPAQIARAEALLERRHTVQLPATATETRARRVRGSAPAGAFVRGAGSGEERRLYRGGGLDVDIELTRSRGRLRLRGQALARKGSDLPLLAIVEKDGRTAGESPIGEHGRFLFERLPEGAFDVVLDLGSKRVRIGPIAEGGR